MIKLSLCILSCFLLMINGTNGFHIWVKHLGDVIGNGYNVKPETTIGELKQMIQEYKGFQVNRQKIVYKGILKEDYVTMKSLDINEYLDNDDRTFHCVVSLVRTLSNNGSATQQ